MNWEPIANILGCKAVHTNITQSKFLPNQENLFEYLKVGIAAAEGYKHSSPKNRKKRKRKKKKEKEKSHRIRNKILYH